MWYNTFRLKTALAFRPNYNFFKKSSLSLTALTQISTNSTSSNLPWVRNERSTFSNKTSLMFSKSTLQLIRILRLNQSSSLYLRLLFNKYSYYYLQTFITLQSLVLAAQSHRKYKTNLLTRDTYLLTSPYFLTLSKLI